jgi:hypothetical protein
MMNGPYRLSVYQDAVGSYAAFAEALAAFASLPRPYWGWGVVGICNLARVDVDTDGLTDDETDQVNSLIESLETRRIELPKDGETRGCDCDTPTTVHDVACPMRGGES